MTRVGAAVDYNPEPALFKIFGFCQVPEHILDFSKERPVIFPGGFYPLYMPLWNYKDMHRRGGIDIPER